MRLDKMVKSTKPRKPLRSFVEIAESLGLTSVQLAPAMKHPDAPKPELVTFTTKGKKIRWYEPIAFIKWYNNR